MRLVFISESFVDKEVFWKAGTTIYNCNEKSEFAYLLKEGEVEIKSKNGTRVGFINKDEVFGEQSILLGTSRTVTAIATKDSSAMQIPRQNLIKEYDASSLLIRAILRSTYVRLTNLASTLTEDLKSIKKE